MMDSISILSCTLLTAVVIAPAVYSEAVYVHKTLFLMHSGTGEEISNLWNTKGSIKDGNGNRGSEPISNLLSLEIFKSQDVDDWNNNPPEKDVLPAKLQSILKTMYGRYPDWASHYGRSISDIVDLMVLDAQANPMWRTRFNITGSLFELMSWMIGSNIEYSNSNLDSAQTEVDWRRLSHQMYICDKNATHASYFSIWNGRSSLSGYDRNLFPVFLFSRNLSAESLHGYVPMKYEYVGCWAYNFLDMSVVSSVNPLEVTPVHLAVCAKTCFMTSKFMMGIELGLNCYCGQLLRTTPPSLDHYICNGAVCADGENLCGGPIGILAVYSITPPTPAANPIIPQPSSDIVWKELTLSDVISWDLTTDFSVPVYLQNIEVSVKYAVGMTYYLQYNTHGRCNQTERKTVKDSQQSPLELKVGAATVLGVIQTSCLWITFTDPATLPMYIPICRVFFRYIHPDQSFVAGPYLAIVGQWSEETTSQPSSTTSNVVGLGVEPTTITSEPTTTISDPTTTTPEPTTTISDPTTTTPEPTTAISGPTTLSEPTTTASESTTPISVPTATTFERTTRGGPKSTTPTNLVSVQGVTQHGGLVTYTTPSGMRCSCRCDKNVVSRTMSTEELLQKLTQLKNELSVNVTELSSYKRRFISVADNRPSAAGVGCLGVLLLTFAFGTIVWMDVATLCKR